MLGAEFARDGWSETQSRNQKGREGKGERTEGEGDTEKSAGKTTTSTSPSKLRYQSHCLVGMDPGDNHTKSISY